MNVALLQGERRSGSVALTAAGCRTTGLLFFYATRKKTVLPGTPRPRADAEAVPCGTCE